MPGIFDSLRRSKGNIDELAGNLVGFLQQQKQRDDEQEFLRRMTRTRQVLGPRSTYAKAHPDQALPIDTEPPTTVQEFKDPSEWSPEDVMFGMKANPQGMDFFQKIAAARLPKHTIEKDATGGIYDITQQGNQDPTLRTLKPGLSKEDQLRIHLQQFAEEERMRQEDAMQREAFKLKNRAPNKMEIVQRAAQGDPDAIKLLETEQKYSTAATTRGTTQVNKNAELEGKIAGAQKAIDIVESNPVLMEKIAYLSKAPVSLEGLTDEEKQAARKKMRQMTLTTYEHTLFTDYRKAQKDLAEYQTEKEKRTKQQTKQTPRKGRGL